MPDHKALCVSLFRRVLRSQPAETSASNVSGSIVLYTFAAAMGLAPGHQFCRRGFAGIAADAQACPVCAHLGALPAASDHFQLPKGLTPNKSCAVACRARSMRRQPQRVPLILLFVISSLIFPPVSETERVQSLSPGHRTPSPASCRLWCRYRAQGRTRCFAPHPPHSGSTFQSS